MLFTIWNHERSNIMKKFGKFLAGTVALAGLAAGAYYVYKNFIEAPAEDDDFDDVIEDEDLEDTEPQDREYVSIDISGESNKAKDEEV